jgi:carbon-monoxide dehydrogenase large subunit
VARGIGQAVPEKTVYDKESGQLLSVFFMDYVLPRARPGRSVCRPR